MRIKDILKKKVLLALSAGILSCSFVNLSYAMPVQDTTKQFDATTSVTGSVMDIAGVKTNNVLNWKSFDIAKGETVKFDAGDQTKNYLNLIHDVKASEIFGTLTGGNNVYLINPNGVLFGAGSSVNVGNLHVSTRALSEVDVNNFSSSGANPLSTSASSATGDITNMGNLVANKVVLEGNNILLQNSAALQNGSSQLTGEAVEIKAKGSIDVGQERKDKVIVTEVNETQFANDDASYNSVSGLGWTTTDLEGNSKTATDYKLIHNVYELQNMKNSKSTNYREFVGNFMLAKDIEAGETNPENEKFYINGYWKDEQGFLPIGDEVRAFVGKFHGANHTINNLYINRPAQYYVGLIGRTWGATVKDVGLINSAITGDYYVGGLVGKAANSTIIGYNTGIVSGEYFKVGGLVGDAEYSTITGYNTGTVSAGQEQAGGLVGSLVGEENGSIITGYNTGAVSGDFYVGGLVGSLVGEENGSIITGYNTGAVSGDFYVGGLVGSLVGEENGSIITGYNTGAVSGQNYVGGLVGSSDEYSTVTGFSVHKTSETDETLVVDYEGMNGNKKNQELSTAKVINTFEYAESPWDISNKGGDGKTWRLYEWYSYPLLNKAVVSRDEEAYPTSYYEFLKPLNISLDSTYDGSKNNLENFTRTETKAIFDNLDNKESIIGFDETKIEFAPEFSKNVGEYKFEIPEVYSTQQGYDIVSEGVLNVIPKEIEVEVKGLNKTYDNSNSATVEYASLGVIEGDKVEFSGNAYFVEGENVGEEKNINVDGIKISGADANNYKLLYDTAETYATINPATLILRAENYNKAYDGTAATENKYYATGLADGDELSVVTKFSGKDVQDTALSISVDSYVLNDGNDGNNYNVIKLTGSGVIYKADLTLTADPATSIMGQPIEKLSGKASGFVSGEGLEEDLLTWTTEATPRSMVGNYAINGSINDAYLATYSKNYNIKQADSNATAYSITSNEQEKIAGYLAQEADYVLAVNPAAVYSVRAETLRDVLGYPELVRREGVGLSEESIRNLINARL